MVSPDVRFTAIMDSGDPNLLRVVGAKLLEGSRIFVSGGAGTGKTYFVNKLVAYLASELRSQPGTRDQRVIVTASTGIATTLLLDAIDQARSLHVIGPFTLHKAALIPWSCDPDRASAVEGGKRNLDCARVVIVDEVSMTDRTTFERFMTRVPANAGILAVGDFFQLPPVDRDKSGEPRFAFHSCTFDDFGLIELEGNHRQCDCRFVRHLDHLRRGKLDLSFYHDVSDAFDTSHPVVFGTNAEVDLHNDTEIARIKKPSRFSSAFVKVGRPERALKWFENRTRALQKLELKERMRVMCIQNHGLPGQQLVNGDIGTVCDIGPQSTDGYIEWVDVEVDRDCIGHTRFMPYEFQERKLRNDREEVVSVIKQLPLIPAYALTVHKAQGMSLDVINIDGSRVNFAPGQVYVAVSRCRTKAGLRIVNANMFNAFTWRSVEDYYQGARRLDIPKTLVGHDSELARTSPMSSYQAFVGADADKGEGGSCPQVLARVNANAEQEEGRLWPIVVGAALLMLLIVVVLWMAVR